MPRSLSLWLGLAVAPLPGCDATTWAAERLASIGPNTLSEAEPPVRMGASVLPAHTGESLRPTRTESLPQRTVLPELSDPSHPVGPPGVGFDAATEAMWDCPMCGMG